MKNLILLNRLGFNPDLTTRQSRVDSVSIASRYRVLAILLLCLTLFVGSGNVWGAAGDEIKATGSITSGKSYYIKGVRTNGTVEYLNFTDSKGNSVAGTGVSSTSSAQALTFTCESSKWYITTASGLYLTPASSNGKLILTDTKTSVTLGNGTNVITIKGASYYLQKNKTAANFGGYNNTQNNVTLIEAAASCTPLTMSTVTATPGNAQIALSWPSVTNANSYTVSCKVKSSGVAAGTAGSVTGTSTKSCTITGLTNGTEYTWSVMPVGTGSYCADNTPATGDATPNVSRTITYYDKDGQHTTSLADGTNIATALTALYGGDDPVSCDAVNYPHFYGWKNGSISGSTTTAPTILSTETVSSSSAANTYYAVFTSALPGYNLVEAAPSNWAGDYLIAYSSTVFADGRTGGTTGIGAQSNTVNPSTNLSGEVVDATWGDTYKVIIERIGETNGYMLKTQDGLYNYKTDNSNGISTTSSASTADDYPLTITFNSSSDIDMANALGAVFHYNTDGYFRFYKNGSQSNVYLYKKAAGSGTYVTNCCKPLGSINGSVSSSTATSVTLQWDKLSNVDGTTPYTVTCSPAGTIGSIDLSGAKATCTVTGLSCGTSYTFSITAHGTTGYCDKTQSDIAQTTSSYSVDYSVTNGSKTSGDATTCGPLTAVFSANSGYHLPDKAAITVTGASDFSWTKATGTLTITAEQITGNISISFTCPADACTDAFSLHTGTKSGGDWLYNKCFSDADWGAVDDAIWTGEFPSTNECYVGYAGGDSYYGKYWAVGGIKTYDIPTGRTLGWNSGNYYQDYPGGALGTFHIYKNSTDENYYLRFKPSSYILRTGSDGTSWTSREMTVSATNSHYYETAELDLTSTLISEHAYVDLKTNGGDGHVWCNFSNDRTASGNVKVKSSTGDADGNFRGDNLKASDNGTHGKFRIDVTKDVDNWKLAFVPMYRITYAAGTGASGSMDPSSYAEISTTIAAAANGFTAPTGKQFNGWSDGVNSYAAGANVTMNSNVTLTAQWTDIDYTVTVSQSPDVSATTTGQTSSAHYNGTINLTTTVPSGYRFVNWTTSDGFSITNPTSATTASFTMPAKNVTVTANFQQTHTVDWYVGGSAPANKIGDDGQTTVVDHGGKIEDFPATTPDGSACDKTFVGWTNTSSYVHGTSPLFNDVAGSPTINADASFYAVFAAGGDTEDEITVDKTGATAESTTYASWSDVSISSDAVYAGNTAGGSSGNASVQMRTNNSNSGIVTTASGGKVTKVIVDWNSSSASGRTLDIYGKNTAYTAASDLYNNSTQGTKLGSIVNGTSTELEISGDYSYIGLRSHDGAMYFNSITISWSSATGHTINCADCGSSVTPTYTAAPTGGTVSVTKSATPVASGSTVKTCTAVDLTVTITPASHYTLTGFTATGLTTGTATISPTVNTVVPTASAQTFTVTVSAGATGTLNLTPTFTAQTPLTITLSTNSKGTFTNPDPWPIYSGETFTFPNVTPSDPTCATFVGWIAGTTFEGDGTTHDAPVTIAANTVSDPQNSDATYTAVFYETETTETDAYVKVTETPANWANDHYLIVYEGDATHAAVAFDGKRDNGDNGDIDAASNTVAVSITSSAIAATNALAASEWKIASMTGGYSIQSASGKYIGNASNSNALSTSSSALANTLSISDEDFEVVSAGGAYLRYNANSGQERFRYYKSSTYTSQKAIQLYKLGTAVVETRTYTTNPSCTPKYRVTVASVTGGSPSADPKFNPESTTVTITANPSAGYAFTSWTITKTTGGDNVTTTLLPGAKATTANTTFSMPAYDVTVTAGYAKIVVSELKVMDGSTVVANTTGSVSGTVNVSTGANKTLDVVITPADAFDHSWTASVTAGGTNASISNVTDAGFRVNGLAQGDATVTVTAPNDGSAKVVTFTVHVTDILPEEIILKRDGSDAPIDALTMYYDAANSRGQYVKVNVSFTPTPTNKDFSVSADGTFVTIHAQAHTNPNYYATLNGNKVTTSPVNVTFTSAATSSVTKNLVVTVLPCPADQFVDYIHGNATETRAAQVSADHWSINTSITTPTLLDKPESSSANCEVGHYHLIGWLPQSIAEALFEAGTPITSETEGLVTAGAEIEASGTTWYAIWAKKE